MGTASGEIRSGGRERTAVRRAGVRCRQVSTHRNGSAFKDAPRIPGASARREQELGSDSVG